MEQAFSTVNGYHIIDLFLNYHFLIQVIASVLQSLSKFSTVFWLSYGLSGGEHTCVPLALCLQFNEPESQCLATVKE